MSASESPPSGGPGSQQPDWKLCMWWVLLGAIGSLVGAGLLLWILQVSMSSTLAGLGDTFITLVIILLQARLLNHRGVNPRLWILASAIGVVAGSLIVVPWLDWLHPALGLYSDERRWVAIVGPFLEVLPYFVAVSLLQALVLARCGPKSKVGWWVLASVLGLAIASPLATLVLVASPDSVGDSVAFLASSLLRGAIYALAQGVTLAFFFRRDSLQAYRQAPNVRGEGLGATS